MAYRIRTYLFVAAVFLAVWAEAAAADECQGFKFEQVQHVSLQDLGRMAQQGVVTGEPGSVVFIPFDEEDRPQQGTFRAIGLVFARVGDLGETPVGGYVWISKYAHSGAPQMTKRGGSVSVVFHAGVEQHCATSQLAFELKQAGKVYVNNRLIGEVN